MTYAHDSLPDVQLQKRPIPTDYYCCFRLQLKPGVHQINVWAQTESQEFQKCSAMVTPVVHPSMPLFSLSLSGTYGRLRMVNRPCTAHLPSNANIGDSLARDAASVGNIEGPGLGYF
jgi:hypothetical protein